MKIIRSVGCFELKFELTKKELFEAYIEQEALFDQENVRDYIRDHLMDDPDFPNTLLRRLLNDPEWISATAKIVRKNLDKYGTEIAYENECVVREMVKEKMEEIENERNVRSAPQD